MQIAGFDQFHQPGTRLGDDADIIGEPVQQGGEFGALQRARGGQNPHDATSGRGRRRLDGRLHANDWPVRIALAQICHTRHRGGIAGQHDGFGALLLKEVGNHRTTLADKFRGFLSIRNMPTITDVQQRLIGQ